MPELESTTGRRIRRRLLSWFDRHRRELPWRRTRDPYRIWISEIMLQQTLVATVIPYYHRFLDAFPSIAHLANAQEQDLLRIWEGLGYYRRARDLQRAARVLLQNHDGEFPNDPDAVGSLPGIGRYTLGAVLSQAFDRRLPILEANSERVLCRVFAILENPRLGPTRRHLWDVAERILPRRRVGDFNQAIMELGALICKPVAPRCAECPIAADCLANKMGLQDKTPLRVQPTAPVDVRQVATLVRHRGAVVLRQRPETGRWAGLWEFPNVDVHKGESDAEAATRMMRDGGYGTVELTTGKTIKFVVTRHKATLASFHARIASGRRPRLRDSQARWALISKLGDYPLSSPHRRLAEELD